MIRSVIVLLALQSGLVAQPPSESAAEGPSLNTSGAARLEKMRNVVAEFKVVELLANQRRPVRLVDTPLLRFNDGERFHVDGTLWVWGARGRPQVFSEVYLKQKAQGEVIYHSLVSASPNKLRAESPAGVSWHPSEPGISLLDLPAAFAPAKEPAVRLRQMKTLVRRFQAWSVDRDNRRVALRLLSRPVHRYADAGAGLTDGAVFAFVTGTNPEVMVLIEAVQSGAGVPSWQFAAVRRGNSAQYLSLDDSIVWQRPEHSEGGLDQTWLYYFFLPSDRSDSGRPRLSGGASRGAR